MGILLKLEMFAPIVRQHGLPHQHRQHPVVEDRQLGHDLGGGGGAGQSHQRLAGKGADGVCVGGRGAGLNELEQRHDAVVGPEALPHQRDHFVRGLASARRPKYYYISRTIKKI